MILYIIYNILTVFGIQPTHASPMPPPPTHAHPCPPHLTMPSLPTHAFPRLPLPTHAPPCSTTPTHAPATIHREHQTPRVCHLSPRDCVRRQAARDHRLSSPPLPPPKHSTATPSNPSCNPSRPTPAHPHARTTPASDNATSVVFARDCGSGRVTIDAQGRPRIHYWPSPDTRKHIIEVSASVAFFGDRGGSCAFRGEWLRFWGGGAYGLLEWQWRFSRGMVALFSGGGRGIHHFGPRLTPGNTSIQAGGAI